MNATIRALTTATIALGCSLAIGTSFAQTVPPGTNPPEDPEWPGTPYPYPDGDSTGAQRQTIQDLSLAEAACVVFHSAGGAGDLDFIDRVCGTNLEGNNSEEDGEP